MNKQTFIATAEDVITDYKEGLLTKNEAANRLDGIMMVMNNVDIWEDSFERGKFKKEIRNNWKKVINE